jgi:predicted PhzF superfamily epimerase YddE/YHI9
MSTVAKFYVRSVELCGWATIVKLAAVTKGGPENEAFFAATPNGTLEMTIKNELAAEQFKPGQEWWLSFMEAKPEA